MKRCYYLVLFAVFCSMSGSILPAYSQSENMHIVGRGETFASIAKKYGISEQALKSANPNVSTCYTGMKIQIKLPSNMAPKADTVVVESKDNSLKAGTSSNTVNTPKANPTLDLGIIYYNRGKWKKAKEYFEKVCSSSISSIEHKEQSLRYIAMIDKKLKERSERRKENLEKWSTALDKISQAAFRISETAYAMGNSSRQSASMGYKSVYSRGNQNEPVAKRNVVRGPQGWGKPTNLDAEHLKEFDELGKTTIWLNKYECRYVSKCLSCEGKPVLCVSCHGTGIGIFPEYSCAICGGKCYYCWLCKNKGYYDRLFTYDDSGNIVLVDGAPPIPPQQPMSYPSSSSTTYDRNIQESPLKTCSYCNGTGLIPNVDSFYSMDTPKIYCDKCGGTHFSTLSHKRCPACDGRRVR